MNSPSSRSNMLLRLLPLSLLLCASSSWGADPAPVTVVSILPDSSLETTNDAATWPKGWGTAKNVTWIAEDGNHFFRTTAMPDKQVGLYMSAPITTEIKALELTFRARVTGLERGMENWHDARVIINFKDAAGKRTPPPKLPYFSNDTGGWITVTQLMRVPETAVVIELMPSLFKAANGTFDIDDIVLKPIDPALVP